MSTLRAGLIVASLVVAGSAPQAQTLKDIEQKEAELVAAWEKSPLILRNVLLVTEKPAIYGAYTRRSNNVFKKTDPILVYMEPVGYGWKAQGPDTFAIGVTVDLLIKDKGGKVLGGQEKFLNFSQVSHARLRELMVNMSLTLGSFPAGDYVIECVVKELGGKSATTSIPFTLTD